MKKIWLLLTLVLSLAPLPLAAQDGFDFKTLDKLGRKFPDAKIVLPGHGSFGGMELIKHTKELCTK